MTGLGSGEVASRTSVPELPRIIEAEPMLPLQPPSPTVASPKAAAAQGPMESGNVLENVAVFTPAAEMTGKTSELVTELRQDAESTGTDVAAEESVSAAAPLPIGLVSSPMSRPVLVHSSLVQKAVRTRLRRTIRTVEGPKELLPLPSATPDATTPMSEPAAPASPLESPRAA